MNTTNLTSFLPFDTSPTQDLCERVWAVHGTPAVSNGNLQLDGASYLELTGGIALGGRDFTISFYENETGSGGTAVYCDTDVGEPFFLSNMPAGLNHIEIDYAHTSHVLYMFVNGIGDSFEYDNFATRITYGLTLGYGDGDYFTGSISNFIIYDGSALHTADFTPPTTEEYAALKSELATDTGDDTADDTTDDTDDDTVDDTTDDTDDDTGDTPTVSPYIPVSNGFFNVYRQNNIISAPLTLSSTAVTPAFAVRWQGGNMYNPLVDPNAANALPVHVMHGGTVYALSTTLQEYMPQITTQQKTVTLTTTMWDLGRSQVWDTYPLPTWAFSYTGDGFSTLWLPSCITSPSQITVTGMAGESIPVVTEMSQFSPYNVWFGRTDSKQPYYLLIHEELNHDPDTYSDGREIDNPLIDALNWRHWQDLDDNGIVHNRWRMQIKVSFPITYERLVAGSRSDDYYDNCVFPADGGWSMWYSDSNPTRLEPEGLIVRVNGSTDTSLYTVTNRYYYHFATKPESVVIESYYSALGDMGLSSFGIDWSTWANTLNPQIDVSQYFFDLFDVIP